MPYIYTKLGDYAYVNGDMNVKHTVTAIQMYIKCGIFISFNYTIKTIFKGVVNRYVLNNVNVFYIYTYTKYTYYIYTVLGQPSPISTFAILPPMAISPHWIIIFQNFFSLKIIIERKVHIFGMCNITPCFQNSL